MRSFITGSYAYGKPRPFGGRDQGSDIDLVVLVTQEDVEKLISQCDKDFQTANNSYREEDARSLRFGNLNLLCVTDLTHFRIWKEGTFKLKQRAPVSREEAIEFLAKLRKDNGLTF